MLVTQMKKDFKQRGNQLGRSVLKMKNARAGVTPKCPDWIVSDVSLLLNEERQNLMNPMTVCDRLGVLVLQKAAWCLSPVECVEDGDDGERRLGDGWSALTKRRMSLMVGRVSHSGGSRERAREHRQRSTARGSSALKAWTIFARRDSVPVGKKDLAKK